MYSVAGSTWQVLSTNAHASNILANMNANLQAQGLPILTATTGNVLWFYMLAAAQEIAQNVDIPLNAAKNSFDLSNCDDNQIYSMLPIAGTSLIPASYSSMYVTFTATNGGILTVTSGSHVIISGLSNKFVTQSTLVVPASQSASVLAVADTAGSIIVVSGQANALVESYANFGSVTNYAPCSVGSVIETAAQARARLLAGNTVGNNLNGVILALRGLPGVTGANVYFNNGLGTLAISGLTVSGTFAPINLPARTAYIVVQGGSLNIASTYWSLMNAPTYSGLQNTVQNVTTLSNQIFPINYDTAVGLNVYVKVYLQQSSIINSGYQAALVNALLAINTPMGQVLTTEYLGQQLSSFPWATIQGVLLSLDGINYGVVVNMPANSYAKFSAQYTVIVLQ